MGSSSWLRSSDIEMVEAMLQLSCWVQSEGAGAEKGRAGSISISLSLQIDALLFLSRRSQGSREHAVPATFLSGLGLDNQMHIRSFSKHIIVNLICHTFPFPTYCVLLDPELESCMACHRCPTHPLLRPAVSAAYQQANTHTNCWAGESDI